MASLRTLAFVGRFQSAQLQQLQHFLGPLYSSNSSSQTLASLSSTVENLNQDIKVHLPKTILDLTEKVARNEAELLIKNDAASSSNQLHEGELVNRVDRLERAWESSNKEIGLGSGDGSIEKLPGENARNFDDNRPSFEDLTRLKAAFAGGLSEFDSRLHKIEVDLLSDDSKAFSNAEAFEEIESLRCKVLDALDTVEEQRRTWKSQHDHLGRNSMESASSFNKENNAGAPPPSFSLKDRNSIIDEITISRPDRSEIEHLVMTRIEPVAGSLNALHMEVGELRRHVSSLPPVPAGLVDQEQLSHAVDDSIRRALSNDGGRVSHAHLTVAIDSCREGACNARELLLLLLLLLFLLFRC